MAAAAPAGCTDDQIPPIDNPVVHTQAAVFPDSAPRRVGSVPAAPICASAAVEVWTGTAARAAEQYPDDIEVTLSWQRVSTTGCVDHYVPSGQAHYRFAIPGALCRQTVAPEATSIRDAQGVLTIDRTTAPAKFEGHGATTWPVTWTCTYEDGTSDTMTFDAGGLWFDASGTVGAAAPDAIEGSRVEANGQTCGRGDSALPCTYSWSFAPAP